MDNWATELWPCSGPLQFPSYPSVIENSVPFNAKAELSAFRRLEILVAMAHSRKACLPNGFS
jgi:hypothetical protein